MAGAVAITGAGRGIGRATALRMAADGWAVAVSDVDGDSAAAVAEEIRSGGGTALSAQLDVPTMPPSAPGFTRSTKHWAG